MRQGHVVRSMMLAVALTAGLTGAASAGALATGDFNGDGFADLAIGVSHEDVGSNIDAGAINVIYGSAAKLASTDNQSWHQNRPGINDQAANSESFGAALAAGDFNADGFDDLAVAVPGEVFAGIVRGAVHILYGTAAGLSAANTQFFDQVAVGSTANTKSKFAHALGVGDFNDDTFDDLVISEPEKKVNGNLRAGVINVVYGSATGLDTTTAEQWSMVALGVAAQPDDEFGRTLTCGDFDGDAFDDLAVGMPGRRTHGTTEIGAVTIILGTAGGLDAADVQTWRPQTPGMISTPNDHERFGDALASGDFNADGWDDLAIGAPGKTVNNIIKAGAVHVLYGTAAGLDVNGTQFFQQNSPLINDDAETKDQFGSVLASGDFNNDGRTDLAIGVLKESLSLMHVDTADVGQVHVLLGSITGLTANGSQVWNMKVNGIKGVRGANKFGSALAIGDFDDDGHVDLAIAAPLETVDAITGAGVVHVLYATANGLEITNNQIWHQNRDGIKDICEQDDRWGE